MVFNKSNVETGFSAELDIGACQKVKTGLLKTAFWRRALAVGKVRRPRRSHCLRGLLLGTANNSRPSRLNKNQIELATKGNRHDWV